MFRFNRTINGRFFLFLVLTTLVLSGVVYGVHSYQIKRHSSFLKDLAKEAAKGKKPTEAIGWYRRYLSLAPDDVEATGELAVLLADRGRDFEASVLFGRLLGQEPDNVKMRERAAKVAARMQRYQDAIHHVEQLQTPTAEMVELKGHCFVGLGRFKEAATQYKAAIQFDPHRIASFVALAGLQATRLEDQAGACRTLDEMVAENSKDSQGYLHRGRFLYAHANDRGFPATLVQRRRSELPALAAPVAGAERKGLFELANKDAQRALALLPKRPSLPPKDAKTEELDPVVKQWQDEAYTLAFAAQCAVDTGAKQQARDLAQRAIDLDLKFRKHFDESARLAENPTPYTVLASLELAEKRPDAAAAILRTGLARLGDDRALLWSLANIQLSSYGKQDREEARSLMSKLGKSPETQALVRFLEARISLFDQDWATAAARLRQVRDELTSFPTVALQANLLLGRAYEELGSPELKMDAYTRALAIDPSSFDARFGRAEALREMHQEADALREFQELIRRAPTDSAARLQAVHLRITMPGSRDREADDWARIEQELELLRKAFEGKKELEPTIELLWAEMLFVRTGADAAEQFLKELVVRMPESKEVWTTLVATRLRKNDWTGALQAIQEMGVKFGDCTAVRIARASYLIQRYDSDPQLEASRAGGDNRLTKEFWQPLRKLADDLEVLKEKKEDPLNLVDELAGSAMQLGDYEHALRLYKQLSAGRPKSLRPLLAQFELNLRLKKLSDLDSLLEKVRRIESPSSQKPAAGSADDKNDGPYWLYGEAIRLVILGQGRQNDASRAEPQQRSQAEAEAREYYDQALVHLLKAKKLRSNWDKVPALQGILFELKRDERRAAEAYLLAFRHGMRSPEILARLIRILYAEQNYAEVAAVMTELDKDTARHDARLVQIATDVSGQLGDDERGRAMGDMALSWARRTANGSKLPLDHVVLGRLLWQKKQLEEAEKELRTATQLGDKEPQSWLALIEFLVKNKRQGEALPIMETAAKALPVESRDLTLGYAAELLRDNDAARRHYDAALEHASGDIRVVRRVAEFRLRTKDTQRAEQLLRSLSDRDDTQFASDVQWSRRRLADLLVLRGGFANLQSARQLIDRNLAETGRGTRDENEDRRVQAVVLSAWPTRDLRLQAIQLLEDIVKEPSVRRQEDLYKLAQLHMSERNWHLRRAQSQPQPSGQPASKTKNPDSAIANRHLLRALQCLRDLAAHSSSPQIIHAYIEALITNQQASDARLWLGRLKRVDAASMATVILEAQVLASEKKYDLAQKALEQRLASPVKPEAAAEEALTLGRTADALAVAVSSAGAPKGVEVALGEFADRCFLKCAENSPTNVALRAAHLVRRNRQDEALALLEGNWQQGAVEVVSGAALAFIHAPTTTPEQLARVLALLESMTKHNPGDARVKIVLAEVAAWARQTERAEAVYRELLAQPQTRWVAANNLAFILGTQPGREQEGLQLIQTAIDLQGPVDALLDTRAIIQLNMKNANQALEDLQIALAESDNGIYYFHLAAAQLALRDKDQAKEAWDRAVASGLTVSQVHPLERGLYEQVAAALRETTVQ